MTEELSLGLEDIAACFGGLVPVALATVSAGGIPNITYVSRAHPVDRERIAVSNQFLSKSSRNVIENPNVSMLLVRPDTHAEYRLAAVYERTKRRGPVFDRLRNDVNMIAALTGMTDVFRLLGADIYRVTDIRQVGAGDPSSEEIERAGPGHAALGELCARISRCGDLDTLLRVTLDGMAELLGYEHSQLLLVDEDGTSLFTIASHGYETGGIGAELSLGEGVIGMAAAQCAPVIIGNTGQLSKYSRSIRRSYEAAGVTAREVPMAGLARPGSQLAVPALALGQLIGAVLIESERPERFDQSDAGVLTAVASVAAGAIETLRTEVARAGAVTTSPTSGVDAPAADIVRVRHFPTDGSTFLDGEYLIKGVAGKLLWSVLRQHHQEQRTDFTNREMRLDPTLELPDFRDNFESRLILLKRRLDDREAPIRIEKTGRGRFRLVLRATPSLEAMPA